MLSHRSLLINHICLITKELVNLVAVIETSDISDEQIEIKINEFAERLKLKN